MSSDNKGSDLTKKVESNSVQNDELDLDKNPIKYATSEPGKFDLDAHDKPYMEMTLRHGKHSELVKKLLRQRIELRAKDFPRWPGDVAGGVRTMWVESRFWYDRDRLSPDFDDDWRQYRVKYRHSLELDPREPVFVPEYEKALINPIRRFYQKPGDKIEDMITYFLKGDRIKGQMYRGLIFKFSLTFATIFSFVYYIRYNQSQWCKFKGPEITIERPKLYAWQKDFPFKDYKTEAAHHWDRGFSSRTIYKDLRDYEDTTVKL